MRSAASSTSCARASAGSSSRLDRRRSGARTARRAKRRAARRCRRRRPAAEDGAPRFHFGRDGFVFGTADGKTELRVRADLQPRRARLLRRRQSAPRHVPHPPRASVHRGHAVRHHRLPPHARLRAGHGARSLDAYVDAASVGAGCACAAAASWSPIGLEWLQKDTTIHFVERSLATDLVPYRDLGAHAVRRRRRRHLLLPARRASTARPTAATAPTSTRSRTRTTSGASSFARCAASRATRSPISASASAPATAPPRARRASPGLPTYKSTVAAADLHVPRDTATPAVADATATIADGNRWRVSPQLYWYIGPVGLLAEYVVSSQRVARVGHDRRPRRTARGT